MREAVKSFRLLGLPNPGFHFTSLPLLGHRIARAQSGYPALLVHSRNTTTGTAYELQYLRIRRGVRCSIAEPTGPVEGTFTVIEVMDGGDEVADAFLRIADYVAQRLGPKPSDALVEHIVQELVRLFSAFPVGSSRELQGLWAELMVICQSRDPALLIRAWRTDPQDWFDFALGDQRLEVKSTAAKARRHRFALEQVATVGLKIGVASVVVKRAETGDTIYDLLDRAGGRITDNELRFRLEAIAGATIGARTRAASLARYDYGLSRASLMWVNGRDIPHPAAIPGGVSEVTFVSDLSLCDPISASQLEMAGELFRAAAPHD